MLNHHADVSSGQKKHLDTSLRKSFSLCCKNTLHDKFKESITNSNKEKILVWSRWRDIIKTEVSVRKHVIAWAGLAWFLVRASGFISYFGFLLDCFCHSWSVFSL